MVWLGNPWGGREGGREGESEKEKISGGGRGELCNRKMVACASAGITSERTGVYPLNTAKQLMNAVRPLSAASRNSHKAL